MPKYVVFRTVGEVSEEEMDVGMRRSMEVAEQMPGVRWIRSYYSANEGKIYCEYEAPSLEAVIEHARRAGIPVDRAEVVQELEPSMFR
jgi:Nickel responsive protein SCO4226-like